MEHVALGKLLPNLKVTVGNDETCIDNSEKKDYDKSERQSDNSGGEQDVKVVRSWMKSLQNPKIYTNKGGAFSTGLDLLSESNTEKLGKRAERFGIEKEDSITESMSSLYESMEVDIENKNSAKMKNIRLDALHVRGINELNTNDIFQYFRDYGPASVEWINDFSCNVVWMDEATCARALLGISRPLKSSKVTTTVKVEEKSPQPDSNEQSKSFNPDKSTELSIDAIKEESVAMETHDTSKIQLCPSDEESTSLDIPVPPGCWRLGTSHPNAKAILLRFATKDDRKFPGAEKRSVFYKKYGNPNYGGLIGLISGSRKRKMQAAANKRAVKLESTQSGVAEEDSSDDDEAPVSKPRLPRMRMYADEEELKAKTSRFKSVDSEKPSVHSRLGIKYTKDDLCHLGSYSREQDERSRPFNNREEINRPFSNDQAWEKREKPFFSDREEKKLPFSDNDHFRTKASTGQTSGWDKKRIFSPYDHQDLRTKIKKLKKESSNVSKYRSPLFIED